MDDDGRKIPAHYVAEVACFYEAHARWLFGHACLRAQRDRELAAAQELAADLNGWIRSWLTCRNPPTTW